MIKGDCNVNAVFCNLIKRKNNLMI